MVTDQSIDTLAATIRRGLSRLERVAQDADSNHPWELKAGVDGPSIQVRDWDDETWSRDGAGMFAAFRCDDPYDDCASARATYQAEAELIVAMADPAKVLARVSRDRRLLDLLLAEDHGFGWTEQCYGDPCLCGRDARVGPFQVLAPVRPHRQQGAPGSSGPSVAHATGRSRR